MLQGINDTLVDRLAENVGHAITQSMNPVTDSMDRFIIGATRNQIDGVNRIVARFLDEMDRSMGNQFSAMASAMDMVTRNQITAAHQTGEAISSAEGIVRNAQALQEVSSRILDKFDAYMKQINTVRERDESFEKRAAELMNRMQQQNREMADLLSGLTRNLKTLPADGPAKDASLTEIRDLLSDLTRTVSSVSETLRGLSEEE